MKKRISLLCLGSLLFTLALSVNNQTSIVRKDRGNAYSDPDKWELIEQNGQVDVSTSFNDGVLGVSVNKSADGYGGVKLDISDKILYCAETYNGGAIALRFTLNNLSTAQESNSYEIALNFTDDSKQVVGEYVLDNQLPKLADGPSETIVSFSFGGVLSNKLVTDISAISVGVNGTASVEYEISNFTLIASHESDIIYEQILVPTSEPISSYGSSFTSFTWGGNGNTSTHHELVSNNEVSKEVDGGALEVSIQGGGSTANRFYCTYFQMSSQKALLDLSHPNGVSFWVYNTKMGGGLGFKVGSEITDTKKYKIFDENNEQIENTTRDLNYVGFRRYEVILDERISNKEFEIFLWGASNDTKIYLSGFAFIDNIEIGGETDTSEENVNISETNVTTITSSFDASLTNNEDRAVFTYENNGAYLRNGIKRDITDLVSINKFNGFSISLSADEDYQQNVLEYGLMYVDETNVDAYYRVGLLTLGVDERVIDIDISSLPYFITHTNVTELRLYATNEVSGEVVITVNSLDVITSNDITDKTVYSYSVGNFEGEFGEPLWTLQNAGNTIVNKSESDIAAVGNKSLSFEMIATNDSFSWAEVYCNVEKVLETYSNNKIIGLSFWIYNEQYVPEGNGFWIKLGSHGGHEYEVQYNFIYTDLNTNNNLMWGPGWQKVNMLLNSESCVETQSSVYRPGTDDPTPFSAENLTAIKFGLWHNSKRLTRVLVDDFRLISTTKFEQEIIETSYTITYNTNGGTLPADTKYEINPNETYVLPIPTRQGYTFDGWYDNEMLFGNRIDEVDGTENVILYAKWIRNTSPKVDLGLILGLSIGGGVIVLAGISVGVYFLLKKRKTTK